MLRRSQLSAPAGVPERHWRDFAFWRLIKAFAVVGAKGALAQDMPPQWVPPADVMAHLQQLVPAVNVSMYKPVVPADVVYSLHDPWQGQEVSDEVSKLLFNYDELLDAEPPLGTNNPGRPRGCY